MIVSRGLDERDILLGGALELDRQGYPVRLLRYGEKSPAFKDPRPFNSVELTYWLRRRMFNLGIELGKGLMVVDRDSPDAVAWCEEHGIASPMEVQTSRGSHLYFQYDAPDVSNVINHERRKVDLLFKNHGVAPPSWVEETEWRYFFRNGIVPRAELPVFPSHLLIREEPEYKPIVFVHDGRITEGMRRYVERIDPSTQGEGGSRACFIAMLKCLSIAKGDPGLAWELARLYNNTRCFPPFDEEAEDGPDSLRRKLSEARKKWRG